MADEFATVPALEQIPGLAHGFGRRARGAAPETREATTKRVAAALGGYGSLQLLHQVHGAAVAEAPWDGLPEADAGVATVRGPIVGIQTADCMPVLLVDPVRGFAAAAHAGWRGTAIGVARAALRSRREWSRTPAAMTAVAIRVPTGTAAASRPRVPSGIPTSTP